MSQKSHGSHRPHLRKLELRDQHKVQSQNAIPSLTQILKKVCVWPEQEQRIRVRDLSAGSELRLPASVLAKKTSDLSVQNETLSGKGMKKAGAHSISTNFSVCVFVLLIGAASSLQKA